MKLDRRYHCFGCGADGDVIDFAAALYGLRKKEAAVQLAQDFGLSYEDWKPPGKEKKPKPRQKSPEEQFQEAKNRCFRILADYLHLLRAWRTDYAPHSPEEAFHPRFIEALQKQDQVEYLLDVLLFGETEEKAALIIVCLEHQLSVIIRKPYGERQKRTEYPEKKSQRDEICEAIDVALARKPKDFRELIGILQEAGYEYKDGKQPALRGKGHARFARFRSLGKGYSVEELCEVIAGNAVHKSKFVEKNRTSARSSQVHQKAELSFLIDVRAKMQEGKGAGYARWAKVFNLKQMAKAMMFMEEHGIKSYAELKEKADGISEKCDALLESVKADEARMSEVSVLRKHLINYAKTKDVFAAYKASGYNREFYEAHRDTLALRSAAKKAFDAYKKENGSDKKLPRISELNAEYAMLLERKKSSYAEYRKTKSEMQDWLVAQKIVQEILKEDEQKKEQLHEQEVRQEEENRQSSR